MKVKELIKQLQQVGGDNNVFIRGYGLSCYDFTGLSFDDLNDVELFITVEDKEV